MRTNSVISCRGVLFLSLLLLPGFSSGSLVTGPDASINVSLDGDRSSTGAVVASGLAGNTYIVRERGNVGEETQRIASFLEFDVSSLSTGFVNSSGFSATLTAQFTDRLNTLNNMEVRVGRVDDDGVNGDTWDTSLAPNTVPLFEWGMASADDVLLVPNARTATLNSVFAADITPIVQAWVNGTEANNGLVLYAPSPVFQGAGFENVTLTAIVPEPTTALGLLGLMTSTFFRRRRRLMGNSN